MSIGHRSRATWSPHSDFSATLVKLLYPYLDVFSSLILVAIQETIREAMFFFFLLKAVY